MLNRPLHGLKPIIPPRSHRFIGNYVLDTGRVPLRFNSAASAALSSRGHQAVDQVGERELRPERAGIVSAVRELRFNVAPAALGIRFCIFSPRPHGRGYLIAVLRTSVSGRNLLARRLFEVMSP